MDSEEKPNKLNEIHSEALREFNRAQSVHCELREECKSDRKFATVAGAQWESGDYADYFDKRIRLEVNKVGQSLTNITNEYRANRITVNFVSKDGSKADALADMCDGLYRADEQDSVANEAYDNAFEEGTAGGMGAWRLTAVEEDPGDPDNDYQRIRITPIFEADTSVYFDLDAKRQDKSDAKKCWVIQPMDREAFMDKYDEDPASWPKTDASEDFDWYTLTSPDVVFIAEYFCIEEVNTKYMVYESMVTGKTSDHTEEDLEETQENTGLTLKETLKATGSKFLREKTKTVKKVHKYIMSGGCILEDCGYIAGSHIPIIPYYGKRVFIENAEYICGHVRMARDPQVLKNMETSKLAELSALSSVEKPIFTPEQMAGHTAMWEDDNLKNYPYLLVNPIKDQDGQMVPAGPLGYTKPPQIPPSTAALLQLTENDLNEILGNQKDGERLQGNISTQTAELIQNNIDLQTYIYMSNFAKAIRRTGQVWLSMAKDIYVEEDRKLKTISSAGEVSQVQIMKPAAVGASTRFDNDLSLARFDVSVEVGPSSATQRSAVVRSLSELLKAPLDPETSQTLMFMIMTNLEGEGLGDIRAYFRKKLVRQGVMTPTPEEKAELEQEQQNTPPDPNAVYLEAAAEKERSQAANYQADIQLKDAKAQESAAKTLETFANIDMAKIDKLLAVVDRMGPLIEKLGAQGQIPTEQE